jgi:hypothetical protein
MYLGHFGFSTASVAEFSGRLPAPGHTARDADGMTAPIHIKSLKMVAPQAFPFLSIVSHLLSLELKEMGGDSTATSNLICQTAKDPVIFFLSQP